MRKLTILMLFVLAIVGGCTFNFTDKNQRIYDFINEEILRKDALNLEEFRSFNTFDYYDEELASGQQSIHEAEVFLCFETPEKKLVYLNHSGLLSLNGSESLETDSNDYLSGIVLGADDFWKKYDTYPIIKQKADAFLEALEEQDAAYTIDYFKSLQ